MKPSHSDYAEFQGSVEGPINPINYSGTQINVWGIPGPNIASFLEKKTPQPNVGYLTDQMIKNLNNEKAIEDKKLPPNECD